ncbi:helix-hairpin-helix domain-containing protein [Senegalia massiliensis]|jgi:competence protein ComEA|uniref:helix-hairpin-helix domain-containing protein n=1 Tax=Senegalia massiliensis TaxID=1720316 RepID=UPI001031BA64|nr:helix-hairpin-helix domain-containing protein [Senegalia massiliensis]
MISFTRKEQIVILILVVLVIGIIGFNLIFKNKNEIIYEEIEDEHIVEDTEVENEDDKKYEEEIVIHISGAVNKSGIFTLKSNSRVNDAVLAAGGLTDEADIDRINLAKKINDEEKIHIYKIGEEQLTQDTNTSTNINDLDSTEENLEKVNINTADITLLESLPGIGKIKANNIIEYRKNSNFKNIEDIMNVDGIGEKTFQNIKNKLTI